MLEEAIMSRVPFLRGFVDSDPQLGEDLKSNTFGLLTGFDFLDAPTERTNELLKEMDTLFNEDQKKDLFTIGQVGTSDFSSMLSEEAFVGMSAKEREEEEKRIQDAFSKQDINNFNNDYDLALRVELDRLRSQDYYQEANETDKARYWVKARDMVLTALKRQYMLEEGFEALISDDPGRLVEDYMSGIEVRYTSRCFRPYSY